MRYLIILILATGAAEATPPWTPCQFQRVAQRALAGEFGELATWQRDGYALIALGRGDTQRAWITYYWSGEPGVNRTTASGMGVSSRVAAMLDVPFGSYALVPVGDGYQLRQVYDRGSRANIRRAQSRGASTWIDLWVPRPRHQSYVSTIYVVRRTK